METNYTPSKNTINLRDIKNDIETNSSSDIPRIIDLSTGESLESASPIEQLQKSRKSKRPIELIENQSGLLSIGTLGENNDDLIDESLFNPHKRIRVSKEYNFIEEEGEIDAIVYKPVVDITKGPRIESFNETNSVNLTKDLQSSQSLLLYGKNFPNIKFTVPYQRAMSRYMRSQFQHLNNEKFENEEKKVILYHPKNRDYFVENNEENYSNGKISEGHNSTISYVNDFQMDLD